MSFLFQRLKKLRFAYIKQYIEAQTGNEVVFSWQGGEPTLMGLEFFQRVVELQKKYAKPH